MMDLVGLQALGAVRTHGSVVAAAKVLGFTPSAVSQQLKKLERQAGSPLLERYGRGVLLTGVGHRLADRGAEVLASMEALESDLAGATDEVTGRVRLAAFSTSVRGLVAPLLRQIAADGTPVEVTVVEQDPLEALDLVATGRVDLALVHHWGDTVLPVPAHVERVGIGTDTADILVPSAHRLARHESVSTADLRSEVFACAPVGSVCHQWLTRMFNDVGGPPRVDYWAAEFSSHIALVEHGAAVSLIPRLGREPIPTGVTVLRVTAPVPTRTVSLVWRRSMAASPTIRHLRELLTAMAPDLGLLPPRP